MIFFKALNCYDFFNSDTSSFGVDSLLKFQTYSLLRTPDLTNKVLHAFVGIEEKHPFPFYIEAEEIRSALIKAYTAIVTAVIINAQGKQILFLLCDNL
jgi:hypothetical protein